MVYKCSFMTAILKITAVKAYNNVCEIYFGTIQYNAKCQSTTSYYILSYLFPLTLPYLTCISMKNPVNLASKDYFL